MSERWMRNLVCMCVSVFVCVCGERERKRERERERERERKQVEGSNRGDGGAGGIVDDSAIQMTALYSEARRKGGGWGGTRDE